MISVVPPEPIAFTAASLPFIVAAFQGLILSAVLWFNRSSFGGSQYANRLLSALLLSLGVLLADYVADYTGHYYFAPYLIETLAPLPFLVGPLLWGYVKVQTSPTTVRFRKSHLLHVIPALLQLLVVLPFVLNGNTDAKILYYYEPWFDLEPLETIIVGQSCAWYQPWRWPECIVTLQLIAEQPVFYLYLKSPLARIWLSDVGTIALWISLLTYIALIVALLKSHQSRLRQLTSNTLNKDLRWLTVFNAFLTLAAVVYIVILFQELFLASTWLEHDTRVYVTYILVAISVIYLGILAVRQPATYTNDLLIADRNHVTSEVVDGSSLQSVKPTAEINTGLASSESEPSARAQLQTTKYRNSPLTPDSTQEIRVRSCLRLSMNRWV